MAAPLVLDSAVTVLEQLIDKRGSPWLRVQTGDGVTGCLPATAVRQLPAATSVEIVFEKSDGDNATLPNAEIRRQTDGSFVVSAEPAAGGAPGPATPPKQRSSSFVVSLAAAAAAAAPGLSVRREDSIDYQWPPAMSATDADQDSDETSYASIDDGAMAFSDEAHTDHFGTFSQEGDSFAPLVETPLTDVRRLLEVFFVFFSFLGEGRRRKQPRNPHLAFHGDLSPTVCDCRSAAVTDGLWLTPLSTLAARRWE